MLSNYSAVKGLAVGAFGDLRSSFSKFIQGERMWHEWLNRTENRCFSAPNSKMDIVFLDEYSIDSQRAESRIHLENTLPISEFVVQKNWSR